MSKQTAKLDRWYENFGVLQGVVSGHPSLPDGLFVHTSKVVKLDREARICETRNTLYTLGEPSEPWTPETPPPFVKSGKYKLTKERFGNPAGTVVYDQTGYDYGLARDDERMTGIEHISVTLNADGSYPGFTVPVTDLEALA